MRKREVCRREERGILREGRREERGERREGGVGRGRRGYMNEG